MDSWENIDYNTLTLDEHDRESDTDNITNVIDLSNEFETDDIVVQRVSTHTYTRAPKSKPRVKKSTVNPVNPSEIKVPFTPLTPKEIMEQQIQSDMDISASTFGF